MNVPYEILLPKILDDRGNLSFFESNGIIPFKIERVYWVYDIPGGTLRQGHAFKKAEEFIIALSGSFDVILQNGDRKKIFHLNRSYNGLYIPNMTWKHMENFSTNSVALVATSQKFERSDYIRDFSEFTQNEGHL